MNGLLSPKETAMRLGIPPGRCRKWIARGTLPSTRDGGRIYIPAKAVDRLLERIASGELPHLD